MKRFVVVFLFAALFLISSVYADDNDDGDGNGSSINQNATQSNTGNDQLLSEINKKTSAAQKVFKNVIKNQQSSKTDFFADVGKNPTAAEFEGKSSSDNVLDATFKFKKDN